MWKSFPIEEAAEVLDVRVGTVRSRLNRGREQMRAYLRNYAHDQRLVCGEDNSTMVPCDRMDNERLAAWVDGALPAEEERIVAHVAAFRSCATHVAELRAYKGCMARFA